MSFRLTKIARPFKVLHGANVIVRNKIDGHALSTLSNNKLVLFTNRTVDGVNSSELVNKCIRKKHVNILHAGKTSTWNWYEYVHIPSFVYNTNYNTL